MKNVTWAVILMVSLAIVGETFACSGSVFDGIEPRDSLFNILDIERTFFEFCKGEKLEPFYGKKGVCKTLMGGVHTRYCAYGGNYCSYDGICQCVCLKDTCLVAPRGQ